MRLLFIDETSATENHNYLGVCAVLIDSSKYGEIKRSFHTLLAKFDWEMSVEFKGRWIFSSSKGCSNVSVEDRIKLATMILRMNASTQNARMKFLYTFNHDDSSNQEYLRLVKTAADKILGSKPSKNGKDLVAVYCDARSGISTSEITSSLQPILQKKGLTLVETAVSSDSSTETVGICYADIVAYLMSRIDNIRVDSSLFEDLSEEQIQSNGQLRKIRTSTEMISMIKEMSVYRSKTQTLRVVDSINGSAVKRAG